MPNYAAAVRTWRHLKDLPRLSEADSDRLEAAEAAILDRRPRSIGELALLLSVLQQNLVVGPRSDERDLNALSRAQAYLAMSARLVA